MSDKEKLIDHALGICVEIYNTNKLLVLNNNSRKNNIIKAKRMFIYFLKNDMNIKHSHMINYFDKMNHSTSIHHVNKFSLEIINYPEIKKDYDFFNKELDSYKLYGNRLKAKIRMINHIENLIKQINHIEND